MYVANQNSEFFFYYWTTKPYDKNIARVELFLYSYFFYI